jgi:hypothetical protein
MKMAKPRNKIGIERDSLHQAPGISVPRPVEDPVEVRNPTKSALKLRAKLTYNASRKNGK